MIYIYICNIDLTTYFFSRSMFVSGMIQFTRSFPQVTLSSRPFGLTPSSKGWGEAGVLASKPTTCFPTVGVSM